MAGVWLFGCVAQCALWAVRWRRVSALVRRSPVFDAGDRSWRGCDASEQLVGLSRPVRAVVSEGSLDPASSASCGRSSYAARDRRPAYRARRRTPCSRMNSYMSGAATNLAAAIHMAIEAIFWFFPPVWWLEKRLIAERERACDEAVLRVRQ